MLVWGVNIFRSFHSLNRQQMSIHKEKEKKKSKEREKKIFLTLPTSGSLMVWKQIKAYENEPNKLTSWPSDYELHQCHQWNSNIWPKSFISSKYWVISYKHSLNIFMIRLKKISTAEIKQHVNITSLHLHLQ